MVMDIGKDMTTDIKININNPKRFRAHRSGWSFVIDQLMVFHKKSGIMFDDFLDITFGYNAKTNLINKVIPYSQPWLGVLHHPPNICPWYNDQYKNSIDIHNFLNSSEFLISLKYCRGIIVLSEYLKDYLYDNFDQLSDLPIIVLKHPTEPGALEWDFDKFRKSSSMYGLKVLSIGYFLRNMSSIYLLKSNRKLDKILLPSDIKYGLNNLSNEIIYKNLSNIDKNSIKILNWQDHSFYDKLLEQSVVFLDLYDTSCNNAIIECIIRKTPMIINRHPAIEEYLGVDYPLFYDKISDVSELIVYDKINDAHKFLVNNFKYYNYLNAKYFIDDFTIKVGDILSYKIIKKHNKKKQTQKKLIKTQITKFDHTYGWEWVSSNLYKWSLQHNKEIANNDESNPLYINTFLDHTFKTEMPKTVIVDDKKHILQRGYNLFSSDNTDVIDIDNKYYLWADNNWQITNSTNIKKSCEFNRIINYKLNEWIGFIHNPVKMPSWFDYNQNINSLLNNSDFIQSLSSCKCIIVLSSQLKSDLLKLFTKHNIHVPIIMAYHPIPETTNKSKFEFHDYINNRTVIQLGYWLRKMHSIWNIKYDNKKYWLYGNEFAAKLFALEHSVTDHKTQLSKKDVQYICHSIQEKDTSIVNDVTITKLNRLDYDNLLNKSVVFLDLYASSANNAILECIYKTTPIVVNRLESTEEYLGAKYPLFYDNIDEASKLLNDDDAIYAGYEYLLSNHDLFLDKLSINNFLKTIESNLN